ncbi:hypothetical protein ACFVVA_36755 [Kitasatospora sp. NPDC058048]|uniref:hypothetical protein n=1 Tax=Kitasatospora sp. NPDC058048 TaxID=3346313 RepID=UPI0036D8E52B
MTTELAAAAELLDSRQDCRWVLSAMEPAERRQLLERMRPWVEWVVEEYDHLQLESRIPRCWYRHKGGRNELLGLYVAWVRVFVEPGETQREMALIEWADALAKVTGRVKFPVECLENGAHHQPYIESQQWTTDDGFVMWSGTDPVMTAPANHPAPYYQPRPKPGPGQMPAPVRAPRLPAPAGPGAAAPTAPAAAPAPDPAPAASPLAAYLPDSLSDSEMQARVREGAARQLPGVGAVLLGGSWWIAAGDGNTWVRLNPSTPEHVPTIAKLEATRASLA